MSERTAPHAGVGVIATIDDPLLPASLGSFLMLLLQTLFPAVSWRSDA